MRTEGHRRSVDGTAASAAHTRRAGLSKFVEFPLESGGTVVVEVDDVLAPSAPDRDVTRSFRPGEFTSMASQTFEGAFSRIQPVAVAIVDKLREAAGSPDEIEVEFGVQLSAEAGAIVAKASGEANFRVSLRWKRE